MKLFQIMPCRLQGYQATLDGYLKTNKLLISYNDSCNNGENILIPSGISDHIGSFVYIPFISFNFEIDIQLAKNIFFIGYGLICLFLSLFFFNKIKFNVLAKLYGNFSIFVLFFLNIFISDTYSFYGLTSLGLIPVCYIFFKNNLITQYFYLILFSFISGLLIAFSETVRGQSGLFIVLSIITYYVASERKQTSLKFISILILIVPLIFSKVIFHNFTEKRNLFFFENSEILKELNNRDIPVKHVRAMWHNAYYNLGFLSYEKKDFPKNTDTFSVKKAKQINPNIIPFTKEYENLLMQEYFKFIKQYPLYFLKISFAKLGVVLMYLIIFINLGLYFLFKNKLNKIILFFFFPGIILNSLLGIAAEPHYSYLLGMFTFSSLMSVYLHDRSDK
jgi:hypothetical protein